MARTTGGVVLTATEDKRMCSGPITIALSAEEGSGAIEISTKDADGRPLPKVKVWVDGPGRRGVTDSEGRARFEGIKAGKYRVGAQDVEPQAVEVLEGQTAQVELTIARQQGEIEGRVTAQGAPVEGARVLAACGDSGASRSLKAAEVVARSDQGGGFRFVPQGSVCSVRAEHNTQGRSTPVTLNAGGPPSELSLVQGATIEGQAIVQATGAPVSAPFTVSVRPIERGAELERRSAYVNDPQGRFTIQDVTAGRVEVAVTSDLGRGLVETTVSSGVTQVTVPVFTKGAITGLVLGKEGPLARVQVTARAGRRARGRGVTDPQGAFSSGGACWGLHTGLHQRDGLLPMGLHAVVLNPQGPTDMGQIQLEPRGDAKEKEGGIGIAFAPDPEGVRVLRFLEQSPRPGGGMEIGDVITAIDGVPAGQQALVNWLVALRGPPGTPVVLQIKRGTSSASR